MNKYKNLAFNTIILAVGTFGSKILSFFLTRLYTTYMPSETLGTKELIETTANFLIPVFTFAISEAVIRFGLDREYDNRRGFFYSHYDSGHGTADNGSFIAFFVPYSIRKGIYSAACDIL